MTDTQNKKSVLNVAQYRDTPATFVEPTKEELRARNRRNYALAASLLAFMVFVFVTMITRASGAV